MKMTVTVNLGNHENMKLESGEHEQMKDCKYEICMALDNFDLPQIEDFQARLFRLSVHRPPPDGHHPNT